MILYIANGTMICGIAVCIAPEVVREVSNPRLFGVGHPDKHGHEGRTITRKSQSPAQSPVSRSVITQTLWSLP